MSEPKLFWYEQTELDNPIAVIGFPSIGLVGSIITSFLARELKLKVVGGMTMTDFQQYTLIQNGNAYPPVRICAGPIPKPKRKKKVAPAEGEATEKPAEETVKPVRKKLPKARDVIVVTSEVAPKPEQVYDFTVFLMDTLKGMGATEFIFVDGIPNADPQAYLMAAYSTENAKKILEAAEIPTMNDGLIRGMSGAGLYINKIDNVDAICVISPANPQIPDPRAAAATIDPLTKLIPRLNVDPTPLVKEAEEIESRVRAQQSQQSMGNQNLYG